MQHFFSPIAPVLHFSTFNREGIKECPDVLWAVKIAGRQLDRAGHLRFQVKIWNRKLHLRRNLKVELQVYGHKCKWSAHSKNSKFHSKKCKWNHEPSTKPPWDPQDRRPNIYTGTHTLMLPFHPPISAGYLRRTWISISSIDRRIWKAPLALLWWRHPQPCPLNQRSFYVNMQQLEKKSIVSLRKNKNHSPFDNQMEPVFTLLSITKLLEYLSVRIYSHTCFIRPGVQHKGGISSCNSNLNG